MTTDRVKASPRPGTRLARSPLAVLSSAVAAFLVAFTLLSARVLTGTDPGLRGAPQAQVLSRTGHTILRTTPSGHVIREQVAAAPGTTATAGLVTSTSGTSGGGEADG
jgi:hypothetical protein